jgi:hypothetical protein
MLEARPLDIRYLVWIVIAKNINPRVYFPFRQARDRVILSSMGGAWAAHLGNPRFKGGHLMSQHGDTGVAKKIDIESISKDLAELANELGNKVEGPVDVRVLKRVQEKIQKILTPAT